MIEEVKKVRLPKNHAGMERRKQRTQEAIFQAAQRLFMRYGIEAVSFEQVAEEAGVSRATLYNHFSNMDALISIMLFPFFEETEAAMETLIQKSGEVSVDVVIDFTLDLWKNYRGLLDLITSTRLSGIPDLKFRNERLAQRFIKLLDRAAERNSFIVQDTEVLGELVFRSFSVTLKSLIRLPDWENLYKRMMHAMMLGC